MILTREKKEVWNLFEKISFRFLFLYFTLYIFSLFTATLWEPIINWIGTSIFKIDYDLIQAILLGNLARPIDQKTQIAKENNYFNYKRNEQNKYWLLSTIEQQLKANFYQNPKIKEALALEIKNLEKGKTTPFTAAKKLLNI